MASFIATFPHLAGNVAAPAARRRFVVALLLAGLLPIPVIALLAGPLRGEATVQTGYHTLFLLSIAHGGLSGVFWLDGRYRGHMAAHPRRYYFDVALLTVLALGAGLVLGPVFIGFFTVIYITWTIIHFARQNWGVACLAALGTATARPGRGEYRAGLLGCAGGAIGVLPDFAYALAADWALAAGLLLVLAGLGLSLATAARQIGAGAGPLRATMTVANGMFFLPVYALGPVDGFITIGCIHAAQYAIIMTVLAADTSRRGQPGSALGPAWGRIGGMVALAGVYLGLFVLLTDAAIWGAWLGQAQTMLNCVVIWHFIVDAGLWRLSRPFQRQAAAESFPFLFASNRQHGRH